MVDIVVQTPTTPQRHGQHAAARGAPWCRLWRDRWMYALMLPGLLYFLVFHYLPMLGNVEMHP